MEVLSRYQGAKKRNALIAQMQNEIAGQQRIETKCGGWDYVNSPLLSHTNEFKNPAGFYDLYFREVLPPGEKNIRDYIEKVLARKKGQAVGLEIGGVGSSLFSQFTPGFFAQTAGVTLVDNRSVLSPTLAQEDAKRNHTVIPGNMLVRDTQTEVKTWLSRHGHTKVDVFFERMLGGMALIPQDAFFLMRQADYWYRLLAQGALAFVQIPDVLNNLLPE